MPNSANFTFIGRTTPRKMYEPGHSIVVGFVLYSFLSILIRSYSLDPRFIAEEAGIFMQIHDLSGQTLGHYNVIRHIGQGGMATVFLAKDTLLGREVAVKVFQQEAGE